MRIATGTAIFVSLAAAAFAQTANTLQPSDLSRMRDVGAVQFSPDGKRLTYSVINFDKPGRPYSQQWEMDVANGRASRLGGEHEVSGGGVWSPDSQWIAYHGQLNGKSGLMVAHPDGSAARFIARCFSTSASPKTRRTYPFIVPPKR